MLLDNIPAQVHMYLDNNAKNTHVVLLQSGVYAAAQLLTSFPAAKLFAIENDWLAAGLQARDGVELISYDTWVSLCAEHKPVVTIQS